jgi:hypothetical protein
MIAGRERGDRPTSAPRPELEKHVLRFATNIAESASSRPLQPGENATASPVRAGAFSQPGGYEMR